MRDVEGANDEPPSLPPDIAASEGRGAKDNAAANAALAATAFRWLESFRKLKSAGVGSVLLRSFSSFDSLALQSGLARGGPVEEGNTRVRPFTEVVSEEWGANA